jgi:hypothetical protein
MTRAEVMAMCLETDMIRKMESLVTVLLWITSMSVSFILSVPLLKVYTVPGVEAWTCTKTLGLN